MGGNVTTTSCVRKGTQLGTWVNCQRTTYKNNKMTEEHERLLKSIDFALKAKSRFPSKKRKREGVVKTKNMTKDIEGTKPTSVPDATESRRKRPRKRPTAENVWNELGIKGLRLTRKGF